MMIMILVLTTKKLILWIFRASAYNCHKKIVCAIAQNLLRLHIISTTPAKKKKKILSPLLALTKISGWNPAS